MEKLLLTGNFNEVFDKFASFVDVGLRTQHSRHPQHLLIRQLQHFKFIFEPTLIKNLK